MYDHDGASLLFAALFVTVTVGPVTNASPGERSP